MDWINLSKFSTRKLLDSERTTLIDGIAVNVFISPDDLPQLARGYQDGDHFIIEIRYDPDLCRPLTEKVVASELSGPVRVFVGRKTKRVYKIEIDTEKARETSESGRISKVSLNLLMPIERALSDLPEDNRDNYAATQEAVASVQSRLLAAARQ